jgi:predicted nucleotide-binding protein
MRKSVKEQYAEGLMNAVRDLRGIQNSLKTANDIPMSVSAVRNWKRASAELINQFGSTEDRRIFDERYEFNENPSAIELLEGIDGYDDMLVNILRELPTTNVKNGYADDVRSPLEAIDELLQHIADLYSRASVGGRINAQTARDGLERWVDRAYKILKPFVGDDEAAKIYSQRNDYGTIENQFETYVTHLYDLKEELQEYPEHMLAQPTTEEVVAREPDRRVFIVHGHDNLKDAVARVLGAVGLEPIILQEKPGGGRTLIEKVEKYSEVGYAVVLLAPDDVGGKKGEEMHDRARQNVIFELGYFVGKLGRGRVALLYSDGIEIPSDLAGIEYIPYDSKDAWKYRLGKELKEASYPIDLNKL